jgi:hypothetical protein
MINLPSVKVTDQKKTAQFVIISHPLHLTAKQYKTCNFQEKNHNTEMRNEHYNTRRTPAIFVIIDVHNK